MAQVLLAHEGGDGSDPSTMVVAVDRVCRRLHPELAEVIGDLGIRLIVARAVKVTQAGFPFLAGDPTPDGSEYLGGLRKSLDGQAPAVVAAAANSLLVNLLVLLVSQLGKNLTLVFLREAWPEVQFP